MYSAARWVVFLFGGDTLAQVIVPITPSENQTFSITLPVNNQNITLTLSFRWNDQGNYWFMNITDNSGNQILDAVPLLSGAYPSGDLFGQYQYLGLGGAFIMPTTTVTNQDPNFDDLGTDFVLVWTDSVEVTT